MQIQHSTPLHKPHGPTGEAEDSTSMPAPPGEGGLAQLLQQVIRKEMRRMVQVSNIFVIQEAFCKAFLN